MLNLTLADNGERLDLPPEAILMIEESFEPHGTVVVYDLGRGNVVDKVTDQFGFVRSKLKERGQFRDAIELTLAAAPAAEPAEPEATSKKTKKPAENPTRRISFSSTFIKARRGLKDQPDGARCQVTVNVNGPVFDLRVTETIEEVAQEV